MTQALLPETHDEPTIGAMLLGESGYAVPWAMWVDGERRCWLHPSYTIHPDRGGTVQMRVTRTEDGYEAWLTNQKYTPCQEPGYVSPVDTKYIPVTRLHP